MDNVISRRTGNVIQIGDSLGLTLREELLDVGLEPGKAAQITVFNYAGRKKIIIEKAGE